MSDIELGKKKSFRSTKTRRKLIEILSDNRDRSFSVEQLHAACLEDVGANLSTIYRTVYTLAELGIITKTVRHDGKSYVQLALAEEPLHGHSIFCTRCNAVADIDICPLTDFEQQIAAQTGFLITSHSIALNGLCPTCKKKASTSPSEHEL